VPGEPGILARYLDQLLSETTTIALKIGAEHTIVLQGRGSAGYGWFATTDDPTVASVTKSGTIPPPGLEAGRTGSAIEVFTITGQDAGTAAVHFALRRPWEAGQPIATRDIIAVVSP
jgi:predicted secreted protein